MIAIRNLDPKAFSIQFILTRYVIQNGNNTIIIIHNTKNASKK